MNPTTENVAYAAGLFEGEGSVDRSRTHNKKYTYPRLQIAMTDLEPLEKFAATVGGTVRGPYQQHKRQNGKWKPYYKWSANGWSEFERIAGLLRPWLSTRRIHQIDSIIAEKPLRIETIECGLIPSWGTIWQHRNRKERPCRTCREWGNVARRPTAKRRLLKQ